MDWDDYKYFSALAATRSVRAAAEQLGVNPSTVSRRLEHFEQRLGVQLFTRSQRGLTITPEGAEVIARVNEIAADLGNIEGKLVGQDQRLSGLVRVVIPEVIALSYWSKNFRGSRIYIQTLKSVWCPGIRGLTSTYVRPMSLLSPQIIRTNIWLGAHCRLLLLRPMVLKS